MIENRNTNSKIWEIKELSQAIKNTIENSFEFIRLRGEISKPSFPSSGHIYFALKDDMSIINATIWKWNLDSISLKPEEGLEVICSGKLTTYPGRSSYQINVFSIEIAGEGALLKQLEERRKKLFSEGYFDSDLKQSVPSYPKCIGVITSLQGAVVEDILDTIKERWPSKVIVFSVPVQGSNAAKKISEAIEYYNNIERNNSSKPDVLIIARGGGSVEDLWAFNEEIIVKSVFSSKLPIISAIGHETDTTLIDYASDLRAPTPTKAAVMATPFKSEVISRVHENSKRITYSIKNKIDEKLEMISFYARMIDKSEHFLSPPNQRLDLKSSELENLMKNLFSNKVVGFLSLKNKLGSPEKIFFNVQRKIQNIFNKSSSVITTKLNSHWFTYLEIANGINPKIIKSILEFYNKEIIVNYNYIRKSINNIINIENDKLKSIDRLLNNSDLSKVFMRGFVYLQTNSGEKITELKHLSNNQKINLTFSDGKAKANILDIKLNK